MSFRLAHFEDRLVGRRARELAAEKRAAVAALLRYQQAGAPEVLLMRRAERAEDRWSGQVSFPGGKEEPEDRDLRATAVRETQEELGVELGACSRFLGPMDPLRAVARGRVLSTAIWPFVFVQTKEPVLRLGDEAAHAFWLPLLEAFEGSLDSTYVYDPSGAAVEMPCWRYQGEVIWGLTFRMLQSLLRLVRDPAL